MATIILSPTQTETPFRVAASSAFSSLVSGNGTYLPSTTMQCLANTGIGASPTFYYIARPILTFDTSFIASASITSVKLRLTKTSYDNSLGDVDIGIYDCSPFDSTDINYSDYQTKGSSLLSPTLSDSDLSSTYEAEFNATGLAYINKTGYTDLMLRLDWDVNDSFTGSWVSNSETRYNFNSKGHADEPKLIIEYSLWDDESKTITSWLDSGKISENSCKLLLENGDYLLLESGDKLLLESLDGGDTWTVIDKTSATWTII